MAQKIVAQEEELNRLQSEDTLTPLRSFDSSTVSERSFQPYAGRSVSAPRRAAISSTGGSASSPRLSAQPGQRNLSNRWAPEELTAQPKHPTHGSWTSRDNSRPKRESATQYHQSLTTNTQSTNDHNADSTRKVLLQQERSTEDTTAKILSQQRELADQIRRERSVREGTTSSGRSAPGNAAAGYKVRPRAHHRQEESVQLQTQAWNLQKELLGASMELMGRDSRSAKASLVSSDF